MPVKKSVPFTVAELTACAQQLETMQSHLLAVVAHMETAAIDEVDVFYVKEFIRGMEKVASFVDAAEVAWRERQIESIRDKAGFTTDGTRRKSS